MRPRVAAAVQCVPDPADTLAMDASDRPRPLYSSLAEDPAHHEAIERFVLALAERIDDLQEAEVQGDFPRVAALAESLLLESTKVGYDTLSRCAAGVRAPALERDPETTRKALIELTEIAHRVRLGHRGAV